MIGFLDVAVGVLLLVLGFLYLVAMLGAPSQVGKPRKPWTAEEVTARMFVLLVMLLIFVYAGVRLFQ